MGFLIKVILGSLVLAGLVRWGDRVLARLPLWLGRFVTKLLALLGFVWFFFFYLLLGRTLLPAQQENMFDAVLGSVGVPVIVVGSVVLALLTSNALNFLIKQCVQVIRAGDAGVGAVQRTVVRSTELIGEGVKTAGETVAEGSRRAVGAVKKGTEDTVKTIGNLTKRKEPGGTIER